MNVKIIELSGGSTTSTKQFIWFGYDRCEARDISGSSLSQYFGPGQTLEGSPYFYTMDQLGSIRELSNASCNIQAQNSYAPFGLATKLQGTLTPDFQYANYYFHQASGLNLTVNRAYSADLGRWINRDPIAESGGHNLYGYVGNQPTGKNDPLGFGPTLNGSCSASNFSGPPKQFAGPQTRIPRSPLQMSLLHLRHNRQCQIPPFRQGVTQL